MDGESIPSILGMVSYGGAAAIAVTVLLLVHVYNNSLLLKSERIRKKLQVQGVRGPPPSLLYGNLNQMHMIQSRASSNSKSAAVPHNHHDCVAHDYTSSLFPYFEQWRREYGPLYTYSTGMMQHLYVNEPEIVKEMNQSMALDLGKPSYVTKRLAPMLGNGILRANGLAWAQQRKIVAPEFYMDKVKGMVGLMVESAQPLLRKWEECIEAKGGMAAEIEVDEDLREVSADVISRACFGSSYSKGKQIFSKLRTLQKLISKQNFLFGANHIFGGFLPIKKQKEMRNLETEIETSIWDAVREREQECCQDTTFPEKDLMQLILEGAIRDQSLGKVSSKSFIVDNCKNIYFAGHETTAVAASWCLMLLALHPEWQDRIRLELGERVTNEGTLSADSMLHLKSVTMVIHEVLRLYPPAAFVSREALEDTKIGNIVVPKGVCLWTLIPNLHRNQEIWGEDANEFKPERFSGGVSKACKCSQAYIPFGIGPRLCLGRNFAISQLKILISLIVSKFKFSLSPNYTHNPAYRLIVEPGYGVCIMVQKI